MSQQHRTVLPSLSEMLDRVKRQGGHQQGLFGEGLGDSIPEIANPHEVSRTHPFTPDRDDDEEILY